MARNRDMIQTVLFSLTAFFIIRRRRVLFELVALVLGHWWLYAWIRKKELT
ncbi:hypothetical protein ACFP7A_13560 [Sporolactobacillus kofuensis]|uniref:Uncharacterized protein n=1 Tax=Sporolactobacillus kofuensis TaxID=269672 RepID=A0ABW1WJQ6_9BACL|nr:hypothetical protein [Sporolactobacillus kofuensis]MCO7176510.1 hypothetical protein [Sporolactobacillus kofuensis]